MALVRVNLNSSNIGKLLKSAEVRADLERRAKNIANAAGEGFEVDSHIGATRARAVVFTATPAARRREAQGKALTRAIDAGRR